VFRSVGDDGNHDESDPFPVNRGMLNKTVDTLDEILGSEIGEGCDDNQEEQGRRSVHAGVFDVVGGSSTCVGLYG